MWGDKGQEDPQAEGIEIIFKKRWKMIGKKEEIYPLVMDINTKR
jgi:hypothetical protein